MPRKPVPAYRRQKRQKGKVNGFVELSGRRHYLPGPDRSAETKQAYHQLLAEWEAHNCRLPVDPADVTVSDLWATFWQYGNKREILLGPKSRAIVPEFIAGLAIDAYLFSPAETDPESFVATKTHRRPAQEPA